MARLQRLLVHLVGGLVGCYCCCRVVVVLHISLEAERKQLGTRTVEKLYKMQMGGRSSWNQNKEAIEGRTLRKVCLQVQGLSGK